MSFTLNNTTLRNLEEQVAYLSEFHEVEKTLASWGIKVVGQVEQVSELPIPYDGDYGDAYAVGTEAPFNFYIWTRASIPGEQAYWFPFGEISIVGPQGPAGPAGERGEKGDSTVWYTGSNKPSNAKEGDMYLSPAGIVQQYKGAFFGWVTITNIMGPQGIQGLQGPQGPRGLTGEQGPTGPQGPSGTFITIAGTLDNADQLPTPTSLDNATIAYLVFHTGGTDDPNDHYDLYIQVGETTEDREWYNAGPFNAGTLVTVNGAGVTVFDADTKVNRIPGTGNIIIYGRSSDGEDTSYIVAASDKSLEAQRIPYYRSTETTGKDTTTNGEYTIAVGTPQQPYAAANKKYVDDNKLRRYDLTIYDVTQQELENGAASHYIRLNLITTRKPEDITLTKLLETNNFGYSFGPTICYIVDDVGDGEFTSPFGICDILYRNNNSVTEGWMNIELPDYNNWTLSAKYLEVTERP